MTDHEGDDYDDLLFMGLPLDILAGISPDIIELQAAMADPSTDITVSTIQLLEQIETCAKENPESSYWDSIKRSVISDLLAVEQPDLAIDVFWTMTSGHEMAAALTTIQQQLDRAKISSLTTELYAAAPYCPNVGRMVQAVRDSYIATQPNSEVTRSLNDYLIMNGIEVDTIEGWIDSQTELYTFVDWSVIESDLKDESTWGDTPVENRLYLANILLVSLGQLYNNNLIEEEVIHLVKVMNQTDASFPDQTYTDLMRSRLAKASFDMGSAKTGIGFANLIKDEGYIFFLVKKLDEQGDTEEAYQLASSMADPSLTMRLLLDTDWEDKERAFQLVENLLYRELDNIERRIGYFTMLRDSCVDKDDFAQAFEIQGIINDLKAKQSED